jgi:hypothetical protein
MQAKEQDVQLAEHGKVSLIKGEHLIGGSASKTLRCGMGASVLQVLAAILQFAGVLPDPYSLRYSLLRMGVAIVEVGIAMWMIQIYRHFGCGACEG